MLLRNSRSTHQILSKFEYMFAFFTCQIPSSSNLFVAAPFNLQLLQRMQLKEFQVNIQNLHNGMIIKKSNCHLYGILIFLILILSFKSLHSCCLFLCCCSQKMIDHDLLKSWHYSSLFTSTCRRKFF